MFRTLTLLAATTLAAPAFADGHASGDAAAGEKAFRQCISCHVVVDDAGETLAGRKAKTGPNLYAVAGRPLGAQDGFKYSKLIAAGNEQGLVWDEESFVGYVQDPTKWLVGATGEKGRGKMSFKVRKEADAVNLYAYLASLAPAPTN